MFFDDSRPDRRKRADKQIGGADRLRQLESSPVPPPKSYELFGESEILNGGNRTLIGDVECYKNYFEVGFKCTETAKIIYFEITPAGYTINGLFVGFEVWQRYLTYILYRFRIVTFNGRTYDIPMLLVAIQGIPTFKLKEISDEIIIQEMQAYEVERKYGVKALHIDHIDLIEVAPISASLKIYGGRLHCERMQDLPYDVHSELTPEQAANVKDYNVNDLDVTHNLFDHLMPHIKMREELSAKYNQDLRSKSDAQIAEAIVKAELEKAGVELTKPKIPHDWTFPYRVPEWVKFRSPQLVELQRLLGSLDFQIGAGGKPKFPDSIADFVSETGLLRVMKKEKDGKRSYSVNISLHGNIYNLAMGGLHSSEESVCYRADDETLIIDRDVASFYPYLILNNKYFPQHLGEIFLTVFRTLVERRLHGKAMAKECKKKGDKEGEKFWSIEADGLKIAINGIFGKFGNMYSIVYSPDLLAHVTIGGQLSLLMMIDMMGWAGIPVISANTDGIVIRCPKARYDDLEDIIAMWEGATGLVTEETRYSAIYSRDVNNYIAVKVLDEGQNRPEIKTKGVFCERGSAQNSVLSKNPENYICSEAVQEYLANGVPVEETIRECRDFKKFLSVRSVKGGAEKDGMFLGKAVRWYYAKEESGTINYAMSGNKVPKSEGAKPCMLMPQGVPHDLDYDHYVAEAIEILYDVGHYKKPEIGRLL